MGGRPKAPKDAHTVHEGDEIGQVHGADEGKVANIGGEQRLLLVDG